jgi:hypothetical protein
MKKLLVVLLSLGLIVAFCATASAQPTVKFGGSYYLNGTYEDNVNLQSKDAGSGGYSHAFFYQRVRLQPVFTIAEGLTFTARMDALEKQWGNNNWRGGSDDFTSSRRNQALATGANTTTGAITNASGQKVQENFEFERAYVTFMTGIGMFQVGYQNVDDWGTDFSDYSNSRPRIAFVTKAGPVEIALTYEKLYESDTVTNFVDADKDTYAISGTYKGKGIEAGLLYKYYAFNNTRPAGAKTAFSQLSPYLKATFGPVYLEGEFQYWFGKYAQYEGTGTLPADVDLKAYGAYLKARFNFGPAYVGALFSYASGNDLSDNAENTTAPGGAGTNFEPALLLLADSNATRTNSGSVASSPSLSVANPVTSSKFNTIIYNAFVGVNPTPKLNVEMALTYATVDKTALSKAGAIVTEAVSDKLGTEVDIKATYKIYDNLSYMIGAGYLWTGDYFKGANSAAKIENDYILMNQLTLSF